MRSIVALAALALSGTIDLAAASACKPRPSHLTSASATTDLIPSDTTTTAATTSETQGSKVIKSVVTGGGFSVIPPDGGVPGFTVDGDANILIGPGYKGDGSQDSGCLSLKASNTDKKRDLGSFVGVSQAIEQLSLTKPYTIRFFYLVITAPTLDLCQLTASLGGENFFQTWILSNGASAQWGMVLEQVTAAQRSASLSISMNCFLGGAAQIYVDSVFMSNQVTPATINDFPLDLGGGSDGSGAVTSSSPAFETTSSRNDESTSVPPIIPTTTRGLGATTEPVTPVTPNSNSQSTGIHTRDSMSSGVATTESEQVGTETGIETTSQASTQTGSDTGSQTSAEVNTDTDTQSVIQAGAETAGTETTSQASVQTGIDAGSQTSSEAITESGTQSATQAGTETDSRSATQTGTASQDPTLSQSQSHGLETSDAQTKGSHTTATDAGEQTSTETASAAPTTSGSSSGSEVSTLKPDGAVSRVCANVGSSSIAGRGCGMQPYNSAGAYTRFTSSNYQMEDCAALCLADENCKSFEWSYNNNCANECRLIATSLSDVPKGNTGTQFTSYDRSCIIEKPCPSYPDDSVCINKMASTPNSGCLRRRGTLKSCAESFVTLTVSPCGGGDQCRDMCAMYSDCQSFSYNSLLQQKNCRLFAGTTNEISEEGGSEYFSDIGCFACGKNMGFSTYALLTNDPVTVPDMTCKAPAKSVPDTPTTFKTRTSQAAESTTTEAIANHEEPTTTAESPTSTSGANACPRGISPPGYCQAQKSLPTQKVSIRGILDHWPQSDNDVEPPVQRTCNAFGVKKNGWWGRTRQSNQRQNTMEDCALLCRQEENCEAFGLDIHNTMDGGYECALSTYKLGTEGIDIGVEWSFWWSDLDCYECHDCDTAGDTPLKADEGSATTTSQSTETTSFIAA
ncbi:hypothetical protein FSARC_3009 [Fusarium sarcochroum]|uniref:Apple domain-containing protein n=1 Tax=Fusarium sarcochroum TaxID=1208366 RepID=A0A8H4U4Z1_9HYPO|nr:hypothetical protein FSARC_3009 [Fusarium sarcochroum]